MAKYFEHTHFGENRLEKASRLGRHYSCFEDRLSALCGNGNYWAKCTRTRVLVTCPACRAKLSIKVNPS